MGTQPFAELEKLIGSSEISAGRQHDLLEAVVAAIRKLATDGSDPLHVTGTLIEGAVHVLATALPEAKRKETVTAALLLFRDRLGAHGLI
jgi:hypothetical protein